MSEEWTHPTLKDRGHTDSVRCRCGRVRRPMEMYDVENIPGVGNVAWLCSACLEDLHRSDTVDRLELHRAKGAPTEWLEVFEAKLKAGPLLRSGLPQHVWGEILADALNEVTPVDETPEK